MFATTAKRVIKLITASLLGMSLFSACGSFAPDSIEIDTPPQATPSTLLEAIEYLTGPSGEKRKVAAQTIRNFGEEAIIALPMLIENLYYHTNSEVRKSAAIAIGHFGAEANSAVPALLEVALNDDAIQVRRSAAETLGIIGDISAIPVLAFLLYTEDIGIRIEAALAISKITGKGFPDSDPPYAFHLNDEGEALIVIAAQEWWEQEGKFLDWAN